MKHTLKKLFKTSLVASLFLCYSIDGFSSHMMGGEVTYSWLGGKKYEITARMYRDCRGIPLNSPTIQIFDKDGKNTMALNYNRVSIEDITATCNSTTGPCSPSNQTIGSEGVELHTFVATVDFAASPYSSFVTNNTCEIYIGLEQCCRNGAITTMSPGNFYVESMMNICHSKFKNSSPQFYASGYLNMVCNQPYSSNLGAFDVSDHDSLVYELINPLNAHNSNESYMGSFKPSIPMTPYCPPNPGVINCKALPSAKPPRGFYFNPANGDLVFTPTKCDEVAVMCVKTSEYRKDSSGVWQNLGFVIRDVQFTLKPGSQYLNQMPEVKTMGYYQFKTGKRQCIDIVTNDTVVSGFSSNNRGDTTTIKILNLPEGAEFSYIDSNAGAKTGRFCWNIHDSFYLQLKNNSKNIPIVLEVKDNYCPWPGIVRKTFFIKALAPDSSGYLKISTYEDINSNAVRDSSEKDRSVQLRFKDKTASYYITTNVDGKFGDSIGKGTYTIGVAPHPYISSKNKDTALQVNFDSTHTLAFGVTRKPGIYGRIYQDKNGNCKYDKDEPTFKGIKVFTDSNKYVGISDAEGFYFISTPAGTYNLSCSYKPFELDVTCPSNNKRSITVVKGNIHDDNDFGISQNKNFTEVAVYMFQGRLRRGFDSYVTLYCMNKGYKMARNIKIYLPLDSGVSLKRDTTLFAAGGSTAVLTIDSLAPGNQMNYTFGFNVSANWFKVNDKICFKVQTDSTTTANDSVPNNNRTTSCGIVNGPYDPNDKVVSGNPVKTILDKTISYTIHFQNTGSDTAFRVIVTDTVDTKHLDISKFELNWSDAPCETIIDGNIISFIFDHIRLPHLSISGDKSISAFNFTLGLKSNLSREESFNNKASIYFDFEDPIHTPQAHTDILSPVSIDKLAKTSLCGSLENIIYFHSNISVNNDNLYVLEMSDANGNFSAATTIAGTISSAASDSIIFTPPAKLNGNYKLRIKTTSPESFSIPGSGVTDFQSLLKPDFALKTNLVNSKICDKDTLRIEIISTQYSYKVLKNNIQISDFSQVKNYNFYADRGDHYTVVAKDVTNHCTDTSEIYMQVMDLPLITSNIKNRKARYCEGEAMIINAYGAKYYDYVQNDISIGKSADSIKQVTLNQTSVFKVIGEDVNGCKNTSDTLLASVDPIPSKPIITALGNDLKVMSTDLITWYLNGQLLSDTGHTIKNAKSGIYKAVVMNMEGCENSSDDYTHKNTGISELLHNRVNIYPNPANTLLTIDNQGNTNYTVYIYDLSGKLVLNQKLETEKAEIDISALSTGMYLLKTTDSTGLIQIRQLNIN